MTTRKQQLALQKRTRSKGPAEEVDHRPTKKTKKTKEPDPYSDDEDSKAPNLPPTSADTDDDEDDEDKLEENEPGEDVMAETPTRSETPVDEIELPTGVVPVRTKVSDATQLTEMQEEYLLQEPELQKKLAAQLRVYVAKVVFPGAKFPLGKERALHHCRVAAHKGDVELPEGVSLKGFAKQFRWVVRDKIKTLRANAHSSARYKFERDYDKGIVPVNFEEDLVTHYRDYLDSAGKVIPSRKKNLKAFIYFIHRVLPSVNYDLNDYGPVAKKNKRLSDCFTRSDEAFALVMVQNYTRRWIRQFEARETAKAARLAGTFTLEPKDGEELQPYQQPPEWFHARWTGSQDGNKISGWDEAGIAVFSQHCEDIGKKRLDKKTGEILEKYIIDYWKGTIKTKAKAKAKKIVVAAWTEDVIDAQYAEV